MLNGLSSCAATPIKIIITKDFKIILKVGDYIEADKGRRGIVTDISIQMTKHDPAGESKYAAKVERYDTSLGYNGAISFVDGRNDITHYWTYLGRITRIVPKEELEYGNRLPERLK